MTPGKLKGKPVLSSCLTTCREVNMTAFIGCMVSRDYSGLIKSGSPTEEELNIAWEIVFNEYLTLSGDLSTKKLLSLLKEVAILSNKLTLIELVVQQLVKKYHPSLVEQLKKMGFSFEYAEGENLSRELQLTIAQSKSKLIRLNQAKAELLEMKTGEGKAATAQDYELQISAIEEFKGVAIDLDRYTVSRYCADINRMKTRYQNFKQ